MKINFKLALVSMILLPLCSTVYAQQWQYQVKPGDTLWSIADEYLISDTYVHQLQQFNAVKDPLRLQSGTTISAPVEWLGNLPGTATVISITGAVEAVRDSQPLQVDVGFVLEAEDKLITAENGVTILEFSDQSTLSIYSNTELTFNTFKQSYNGDIVKARIGIKSGRININTNPENKPGHRLEIESPAAITAVRGTEFRIGVNKDNGDTVTEVLSGDVSVSVNKNVVAVQRHYGTKTETGKTPINPVRLIPAPEISFIDTIESKVGKLSWSELERAQSYRVRVAGDEKLTDIVYDKVVFSTEVSDVFFPDDGSYFTSVRAIDSNDIEGLDAVAKISVNARPDPPLILGPKDGTSSFNSNPVFSWATSTDVSARMHYQLANNEQFDPLLIDKIFSQTNSFTPETSLPPGDYYWRIANLDNNGRGPFSESSILSIKEQPTLAPEISDEGSSVSLSLSQDPSISRYHIQVSRDANFTQIIHEQWSDGKDFSFNTQGSGSYYIRLGIENGESTGDIRYSDPQKMIVPFKDWTELILSLAAGLLIIL